MHVFDDIDAEEGCVATIRLDRLGLRKIWQRKLGINYAVLHVKGEKPIWPNKLVPGRRYLFLLIECLKIKQEEGYRIAVLSTQKRCSLSFSQSRHDQAQAIAI